MQLVQMPVSLMPARTLEECVDSMESLQEYDIYSFGESDFKVDKRGCIWNRQFFDGCTFLFIVWHTPTLPVMVYNEAHVKDLSKETRDKEWIDIWYCMYIKRTPETEKWERSKVWDEVIDKMQKHIWAFDLGRY